MAMRPHLCGMQAMGGMAMQLDAILAELVNNIAVVIGSIVGSTKAQLLSKNGTVLSKIVNAIVGIFAGITLAFHYLGEISPWGAAVLALIASSMSVAIIDAMSGMAPEIVNKLVEKWFGIDKIKPK